MFNQALLGNRRITLSAVAQTANNASPLYTLTNHIVEIDISHINIGQAILFQNCLFVFPQNSPIATSVIFTTEAVRIENSRFEVALCIWGQLRQNNVLGYLGQDGSNVFIENCEFAQFQVTIGGVATSSQPSIQLSGLINYCKITCGEALRVSLLQCKFVLGEFTGICSQFQISETLGRELKFTNFQAKFMWFQRPLIMQIQKVEIDELTISNIAKEARAQNYPSHLIQAMRMFMDVFKTNRNGAHFLKMNTVLCSSLRYKRPNLLKHFAVYGIFKNFYSAWRMLAFCVTLIVIFGLVYYSLVPSGHPNQSLKDWTYFSAVTFTTLGYGDIVPQGILRLLAPLEALIGIISVIVTSWIFSRQFNDY